ncbi:hypothetical protein RB623_24230 [Mesorhizobium sp. LHD-90]|uniref:hypothetical protein n=1 Tax=Mesorhizobium sp. LHD-90 TaxID=3071414 RepID=UPI0027E07931|nr:hypothetical protein [Mesorhizobium sp. LHD-90]MDQ6437173.1 hypothetical protein [Mesorhizobium sp. LHD-90]
MVAESVMCEVLVEGEILELGSYRFIAVPRVGEVISVSVTGQETDELFRVVQIIHSAFESREPGDHIKLIVTKNLGV